MASCYKCGRYISFDSYHYRRRVKVSESVNRSYNTSRPDRVHTRYAFRVVCTKCAYGMDLVADRDTLIGTIKVFVALLVFIGLMLFYR